MKKNEITGLVFLVLFVFMVVGSIMSRSNRVKIANLSDKVEELQAIVIDLQNVKR